jgi:hypothetical protein
MVKISDKLFIIVGNNSAISKLESNSNAPISPASTNIEFILVMNMVCIHFLYIELNKMRGDIVSNLHSSSSPITLLSFLNISAHSFLSKV